MVADSFTSTADSGHSTLQPEDVVERLSDVNPFTGLERTYQQSQFFAEQFHLLVIRNV